MLAQSLYVPARTCRPTQRLICRVPARTLMRPARSSVAAQARLKIDPFNGCNCYYLLTKSKAGWNDGNAEVMRTLDQIKEVGFTVIRTWAFQDDPAPNYGGALYYYDTASKSMKVNPQMLAGLMWLLDEAQKRGLKLMLALTNGNPADYGGMRQYVRWSQLQQGKPEGTQPASLLPNSAFYDDPIAQKLFKDYLNDFIPRIKNHPAVHSWDLANEPRCDGDHSATKISSWIEETAAFVKGLDKKHPITVGLDGFFGPSTPELAQGNSHNPYWGSPDIEGCDFVGNCKSSNLDFASIHLYPSNWNIEPESNRASWAMKWIQDHIDVVSKPEYGLNMPLVLQEFNLTPNGSQRVTMFQQICDLLVEHKQKNGPFVGSMVWCMSDPAEAGWDQEHYYLYAPSVCNDALNNQQVAVLQDCSKKMNAPATS